MAEFPALPLFTDAYLADTRHLTTAQHGAYLLLLIAMWRTPDCRLPNDDGMLGRIAGCTPFIWKNQIKPAIWNFFTVTATHILQNRLLRERKFVEARRDQQISAGLRSAIRKKQKRAPLTVSADSEKIIPADSEYLMSDASSADHVRTQRKPLNLNKVDSTSVASPLQRKSNDPTLPVGTSVITPTPTPPPTVEKQTVSPVVSSVVRRDLKTELHAAAAVNGNGQLRHTWPQAARWIQSHFPKTDDEYAAKLTEEIATKCRAAIQKAGGDWKRFSDEAFVHVLEEARFPKQESAAGFKKTAPAVAANWSKSA